MSDRPAPKKAKISVQSESNPTKAGKSVLSLDPYKSENRLKMIQNGDVGEFLTQRPDAVHFHSSKLPTLPCQDSQKRKLKKPVRVELSSSVHADVTGHLGSGAFAHVFSATVTLSDAQTFNMALKVRNHCVFLLWL